jgi:hypothetical protein
MAGAIFLITSPELCKRTFRLRGRIIFLVQYASFSCSDDGGLRQQRIVDLQSQKRVEPLHL